MAGPFPGMDPWLEARGIFPDVHNSFIANLKSRLNACLPSGFVAQIASSMWIAAPEERFVQPDISVVRVPGDRSPSIAVMEPQAQPVTLVIPRSEIEEDIETAEWYLEIRTIGPEARLVTSVELLSRSNKIGGQAGRDAYRLKQLQLFDRRVNLVEIDLLRFGQHATRIPRERLRGIGSPCDYHISVSRGADRADTYDIYPIGLRQPLPIVEFPLVAGVPGVSVALQAVVDFVYEDGRYGGRIDYHQPCDPPLNAEQSAWAASILQSRERA